MRHYDYTSGRRYGKLQYLLPYFVVLLQVVTLFSTNCFEKGRTTHGHYVVCSKLFLSISLGTNLSAYILNALHFFELLDNGIELVGVVNHDSQDSFKQSVVTVDAKRANVYLGIFADNR